MTAFLRFEIVRSLRNVRFVVFIAGFPVLLYLIYAKQTGISQGLTVAAILMVSMAVWSGMGSAIFATGPQLAKERQNGWMRQLRVSPISAPRWFVAKLAQGLLLIIPGFVLLLLLGFGYGHVHLAASRAIRRVHAGERVVDPALAAAALAEGASPLTPRETEVLSAARGHAAISDLAASLHLSQGTVRNHLSAAIQKLGARNRAEAVQIAERKGWL